MRDAFGGEFMIRFLLVFIFIYVAFTAVSLNYAKAFRVKNAVIDFVEQNEIKDLDEYFSSGMTGLDPIMATIYQQIDAAVGIVGFNAATKSTSKLDEILADLSYNKTCDSLGYTEGQAITTRPGKINRKTSVYGYCYKGVVITKKEEQQVEGANSKIVYYEVITYADWQLGALSKLLALAGKKASSDSIPNGSWAVKGEAKVVVKN